MCQGFGTTDMFVSAFDLVPLISMNWVFPRKSDFFSLNFNRFPMFQFIPRCLGNHGSESTAPDTKFHGVRS